MKFGEALRLPGHYGRPYGTGAVFFFTQKCAFFCVFDTATGKFTEDKGVNYLFCVNLPVVGIPGREMGRYSRRC